MIITSTRISTKGGVGNVLNHVLKGKDNEEIRPLAGTVEDMRHALLCAQSKGARYCLRHFSLSPEVETSRKEAGQALKLLSQEYGFADRPMMVVEHVKPRQDGAGYERHWHCLVAEVSPNTLRVMSNRSMYRRNEKVARLAEFDLGQPLTKGAHNRSVVTALRAEGRADVADAMEAAGLTEGKRPRAAYDKAMHQEAKRRGKAAPETLAAVKRAWERAEDLDDLKERFRAEGLRLRKGDRRNVPVVTTADGQMVGSLPRLLRQPKAQVMDRLRVLSTTAADNGGVGVRRGGGGAKVGGRPAAPAASPSHANDERSCGTTGEEDYTRDRILPPAPKYG